MQNIPVRSVVYWFSDFRRSANLHTGALVQEGPAGTYRIAEQEVPLVFPQVGFAVGMYDACPPLIIDLTPTCSTFPAKATSKLIRMVGNLRICPGGTKNAGGGGRLSADHAAAYSTVPAKALDPATNPKIVASAHT
jgi:hypothetical protein